MYQQLNQHDNVQRQSNLAERSQRHRHHMNKELASSVSYLTELAFNNRGLSLRPTIFVVEDSSHFVVETT